MLRAASLACLLATPALATERVGVLVFDASGSMWNRIEGDRTRIEVARDVVGQYFTTRDGAVPLSVIAYGHNRRGDCRDIEVIAPMARADGPALADRLRRLTPRGMTPLTDSLRQARAQIPANAESADIILVTDGLETCRGDPCALAAEFAAEGIAIRAHVVGFGLTRTQVQALSCITEQTGGRLFETNSGAELADALRQASAAPPPAPASPPPAPAPAREAAFDIEDKAEAGFTYRIRWRGEARHVDYLGFVPRGADRSRAGPGFGVIGGTPARPNNPVARRAPAEVGQYDLIIRAAAGGVIARQAVEVVAPNMGFEAVGSVEPGARVVFTFRGPNLVGERVVIARPGDPPRTHTENWANALASNGTRRLRVPQEPGEYEIRYLNAARTEVMFARRFGVGIPFQDAEAPSVADLAARAAAATQAAPGQDNAPEVTATFRLPMANPPGPVSWSAEPLDPDLPPEAWAPQEPSIEGRGQFVPGRYRVSAVAPGEVTYRAEVEIQPGQDNVFTVQLASAEAAVPPLPGTWTLYVVPPHGVQDAPSPMLTLDLARDGAQGPVSGRWTSLPPLAGAARAGRNGTLQSATIEEDGLLRMTFDLGEGGPGTFTISLRPYQAGFAGSLSAGGRGVRALLWRQGAALPPIAALKAALHGPAP
jgi:hypothetical protein